LSLLRLLRPLAAALSLCLCAQVSSATAADLPPDQQAAVQRATAYIQDLRSVTGRFTQTDPNGGTSTGTLYLQRPGKARFEYDPPAGLLVVSDGQFVGVSDRRLKTFNEYPLGRTPLVLLLAREVRLDRGVVVTGVDDTPNGFTITARDKRGEAAGKLTLIFSTDPIALKGWNLVDGQGRRTQVRLGPLSPAPHLAPGLFYIRDVK
jgi:outer membrane lipoprotein-sorting protein